MITRLQAWEGAAGIGVGFLTLRSLLLLLPEDSATFRNLLDISTAAMRRIPGVQSAAVAFTLPYERPLSDTVNKRAETIQGCEPIVTVWGTNARLAISFHEPDPTDRLFGKAPQSVGLNHAGEIDLGLAELIREARQRSL